MRQSKNSIQYYGPAEVRGKYARPAVNVDRLLSEAGEVLQKDNPVLSRPVTSGSLIAKTRVDSGVQVDSSPSRPETRSKTPGLRSRKSLMLEHRSRPHTAHRLRTRTHSHFNGDEKAALLPPLPQESQGKIEKMMEIPLMAEENNGEGEGTLEGGAEQGGDILRVEGEAAENPQAADQEGNPQVDVPLPIERPATATTWKTTSSQRRYIDELERLLKEERKVRFHIETHSSGGQD